MGEVVRSRIILRVTGPIAAAAFIIGATFALTSGPAEAKKCIAEALGFPCKKCHNDPAGGKEEGWNAYGQKFKAKGNFPC
jgi:hypothetical protein